MKMMHNKVRTSKKCFLRWFFKNGTNILVIHDAPHWWYMILATYHVQCWNGRSKPYRPRFVLYQHSSLQRFLATKIMQHCKKNMTFSHCKENTTTSLQKKMTFFHYKENKTFLTAKKIWHSFTKKKTRHSLLQRKHDIPHYKKIKHDILHYRKENTTFLPIKKITTFLTTKKNMKRHSFNAKKTWHSFITKKTWHSFITKKTWHSLCCKGNNLKNISFHWNSSQRVCRVEFKDN
jgi:hypothetical protein